MLHSTLLDTFEYEQDARPGVPIPCTEQQGSHNPRYGHAQCSQCRGNKPTSTTGLWRMTVLPELRKEKSGGNGLKTRILRPGPRQALEYSDLGPTRRLEPPSPVSGLHQTPEPDVVIWSLP